MQEVMFYNPQLACLCRGWSAQFYCSLFSNCKNLGKIFDSRIGTAKKMETQRQFCLFSANYEWMDTQLLAPLHISNDVSFEGHLFLRRLTFPLQFFATKTLAKYLAWQNSATQNRLLAFGERETLKMSS